MKNIYNQTDDAATLRRQAAQIAIEKASRSKADLTEMSPDEMRKILHELRVHQIELEMQNDELRKTQIELERLRMRYMRLYQNAPTGYVVLDDAGLIVEANATFLRMTQWKAGGINGTPFASLLTTGDETVFRARYKSLFRNPGGKMLEVAFGREMDVTFYAQLEAAPQLKGDSHRTGTEYDELLITVSDVTERKRAEDELSRIEARLRQSEKMEAIGQLAGGIAHDFNNVLGGIIGFTDMSLNYADHGSTLEGNLFKVLKAADRAKNLVKQILTFSRQGSSQKSPIAIRPIVIEVLDLLKSSIPSSVTIRSDLQAGTKLALADSTQIHQAILNLATNSVYAMSRKGTLTVRLFEKVLDCMEHGQGGEILPGEYIVVEVADTGCGMDTETLSKVFEPFFTTKPVGEGTGMGLSVVLGIVLSHGGELQAESEVGKGTTMRIFLPVVEESAADAPADHVQTSLNGTERILFVDDEEILVDMNLYLLTQLGYTVTTTTNSDDALQMIREKIADIDILITDQTMPGLTGIELAKEALLIRKDLPIILCTGFSNEVNRESATALGIKKFIKKPYRSHEISKAIREVLDTKKTEA